MSAATKTTPTLDTLSVEQIAQLSEQRLAELIEEREKWTMQRAYETQMLLQTRGQLPFAVAWSNKGVDKLINS